MSSDDPRNPTPSRPAADRPAGHAARHAAIIVPAQDAGARLDAFLARHLPDLSRSRIKALIAQGHVRDPEGPITEPARRVKPDEAFGVTVPAAQPARPQGEDLAIDVLFEDEHLIVVEKPAGMVVHPAPGHADGTLVNALIAHCGASLSGIGGVRRPGIVHRIDRDVSGVLVIAKTDQAHLGLAAQFSLHTIERIYEAIVVGLPDPPAGTIDAPIGRDPRDRLKMAVTGRGKRAVTHYRLLDAAGIRASRLEIRLETGRTHQIRVHLASRGHAIVGDRVYGPRHKLKGFEPAGERIAALERILLHARTLGFDHPVLNEPLRFERPAPALFGEILELLRD